MLSGIYDMLCNKSRRNPTVSGLSQSQELAIDSLLSGSTITAAATAAGVDRTTVHRWLADEGFRDEYEYRRVELQSAVRDRLMALTDKAVDVLEKSLDDGDAKSALALLRGLGMLNEDATVAVSVSNRVGVDTAYTEPMTQADATNRLRDLLQDQGVSLPVGFEFRRTLQIPFVVCEESE
jgi:hypothetical protein